MNVKTVAIAAAVAAIGLIAWAMSSRRMERDAGIPELVQAGALIIDTRTPQEFSSGHVQGAINLPYDQIAERIAAHAADKSQPIVVYCQSGRRSAIAKATLEKSGYTQVVNAGGKEQLDALLTAGDLP